jgi:hypothetical protein
MTQDTYIATRWGWSMFMVTSISITKASSFDVYTNLWIVEFLYYVENPQELALDRRWRTK